VFFNLNSELTNYVNYFKTAPMILKNIVVGILVLGFSSAAQAGRFDLPLVGAQAETWTCGPNAGTRVLRYYGSDVTLAHFIATSPKSIDMAQINLVIGPAPIDLANHMNQLLPAIQFEVRTDLTLDYLIGEVEANRPVIVLIKTGEENQPAWGIARLLAGFAGGLHTVINQTPFARDHGLVFTAQELPVALQTPVLHYITINGWDSDEEGQILFSYMDSDDQEKQISYAELALQWDWAPASPFVERALTAVNVRGKSMIVVKQAEVLGAPAPAVLPVD
jgi:hypothetical protein